MTDEDIDYSDIPELGDEFFEKATVSFPSQTGDSSSKNEEESERFEELVSGR